VVSRASRASSGRRSGGPSGNSESIRPAWIRCRIRISRSARCRVDASSIAASLPDAALDTRSSIRHVLGSASKLFEPRTPRPRSLACFTTNVNAPSTRAAASTDTETGDDCVSPRLSSPTICFHQSLNGPYPSLSSASAKASRGSEYFGRASVRRSMTSLTSGYARARAPLRIIGPFSWFRCSLGS
jgi:hypothetical protein